jgi:trimethylamine:corrinoid methyltransferase-like protein
MNLARMPKGGQMKSGGLTGGIYKPLSSEQVELIHGEALRLLEEVGMAYESGQDDVLELVKHAGCRVDPAAMRIFFPAGTGKTISTWARNASMPEPGAPR